MDQKVEAILNDILKKVDETHAPPKEKEELKGFIKSKFEEIGKGYGQKTIFGD